MAILPRRMPDRPEVAIAAALIPARSVGGDLYDFIVDGDDLWFIVADVSGKGVGAALYMAVVKTLFRATIHLVATPAEVLARMNRELCRDNDQMMFITAVVGRLSLTTGDVALGDAGHNPALILGVDRGLSKAVIPKSIALGVMDNATFESGRVRLAPGSTLVLYTDGATDARDTSGGMFGSDRLDRLVAANAGKSAADLVDSIIGAVQTFEAGGAQEDDLTLLAIQYRGTS
jgi:phosphoserine phosphatase RsbU/P